MKVLNVGGGTSRISDQRYFGWEQRILDIDPAVNPDILLDAKEMNTLEARSYDAVYCSHNLEHFYFHEVPLVLEGFIHVLKEDGFAEIAVPNLTNLFQEMHRHNLDIMDVWYRTGENNPITFHDTLYGWNAAMKGGNLYYAHKCGFTASSLHAECVRAGFKSVWVAEQGANLLAFAYKKEGVPCPQQ